MKGNLMKAKLVTPTVFVDHYSDLSFVYMQKDKTREKTLKGKFAFDTYAKLTMCGDTTITCR